MERMFAPSATGSASRCLPHALPYEKSKSPLLHGRRLTFVEREGMHDGAKEAEANRWAPDFLIPLNEMARLLESDYQQRPTVVGFARELGIAPGIVVGRLQKDEHLAWGSTLNKLKCSFTLR